MTLRLPINNAADWQWECLEMTFNSNVETDFTGVAAVSGNGYVIEQNEIIDWQSLMVFVQVAETAGSKTLNLGILSTESGGNAAGFLNGISIASVGYVRPAWTLTSIASVGYYISATTLGALFQKGNNGTSTLAGEPIYQHYMGNGTAKTLTYTCSASSASFVGYLLFRRFKAPDLTNFLK